MKKRVYHHLISRFVEIMADARKKEKLVANVVRLLKEHGEAARRAT